MPGDEDTYVVAMADGDRSKPYVLQPGARVRLISDYSAAERRLGAQVPHVALNPQRKPLLHLRPTVLQWQGDQSWEGTASRRACPGVGAAQPAYLRISHLLFGLMLLDSCLLLLCTPVRDAALG